MAQQINITSTNVVGRCENKCSYNIMNYSALSNLTLSHQQGVLVITQPNSTSSALFNQMPYTFTGMMIVAPSVYLFNGAVAPAMLSIYHQSNNQNLFVFIPIKSSSSRDLNPANTAIEQIIDAAAGYAPQVNETTTQGLPVFSLKDLIPREPFYVYLNNQIVFGINSAIVISDDALTTLTSLVTANAIATVNEPVQLYLSLAPPSTRSSNSDDDNIYIDCQPTDQSDEEQQVQQPPSSRELGKLTWKILINNQLLIAIVSVVIFVLLLRSLDTIVRMASLLLASRTHG
jgi:hypothetical protein